MPPKISAKTLQMPNISSPNDLILKKYLKAVKAKNKGNHQAWITGKWDDITDSYLQVHEHLNGKNSPGYKTALNEVSSLDLRAKFEYYRKMANLSKEKHPVSLEGQKTENNLTVPNPRRFGNLIRTDWTYHRWIRLVETENPDVELTREMADEMFAKFEVAAKEMVSSSKLDKAMKEKLSHMWTERKKYWRNEEKISQRKKGYGF